MLHTITTQTGVTLDIRGCKEDNRALFHTRTVLNDGQLSLVETMGFLLDGIWSLNTDPCFWVEVDATLLKVLPGKYPSNTVTPANSLTHAELSKWKRASLAHIAGANGTLVYGTVNVDYLVGIRKFRIYPNRYDFDIKKDEGSEKRNFATEMANFLHGQGTPFWVVFKGLAELEESLWVKNKE